MTDLAPIALFVGCLLATLGLVRLCDRLSPNIRTARHVDHASDRDAHASRGGAR